jgi:hypothetical protein
MVLTLTFISMKKLAMIAVGTIIIMVTGCKKNSTTVDTISADLQATQGLMSQDYSKAQQAENSLSSRLQVPGTTWTDQTVRMYETEFHDNDTMFTENFRHYSLDMMEMAGMNSNGMMTGSGRMNQNGGMMCNMDSLFGVMGAMPHMTTYRIDSMMLRQAGYCPAMGNLPIAVQDMVNEMQTLRKQHVQLHQQGR